jgi:hypothetical protein
MLANRTHTPSLSVDHQRYMVRAHRLRSAAVAGLFRELARWVSHAAR